MMLRMKYFFMITCEVCTRSEVEVYEYPERFTGKGYASVICTCDCAPVRLARTAQRKDIAIPGVLLDYIDGFPLTDIASHAPKEIWQSLCDDAIRIVHRISDHGILSEDVNTRSFIVHKRPSAEAAAGYKVLMINFALCKLRKEYEDDNDWTEWKAIQDEEGAVGFFCTGGLGCIGSWMKS